MVGILPPWPSPARGAGQSSESSPSQQHIPPHSQPPSLPAGSGARACIAPRNTRPRLLLRSASGMLDRRTVGAVAMVTPSPGAKIQMCNRWGLRSIHQDGLLLALIWAARARFGRCRFGIAPGGLGGCRRGGAANSWRQQRLQKAQLSAEPASACGQKSQPANIPEYSSAGEAPPAHRPPPASSGEREHAVCSPACARSCLEPRRELRRKGRRGHRSTPLQEPSPRFNGFPDVQANPAKLPAMNN